MEQRTMEWYVARLGKVTSSEVGNLIGKGKAKDAVFTKTGYTYLYRLIAERCLNDNILTDELAFGDYRLRTHSPSYATSWGELYEAEARSLYATYLQTTDNILQVEEVGFVEHPTIKGYGDSADGVIYNGFEKVGTLEIKCPYSIATTATYLMALGNAEDKAQALKDTNAEYYWQCVSHCVCHDVAWCDFVVYDPMLKGRMWVYRITPPKEDIDLLTTRVIEATEFVASQMNF